MAVTKQLWRDILVCIVHLDSQRVLPGIQEFREIVNLLCGNVIVLTCHLAIHKHLGSFRALHVEEYAFLFPFDRDGNLTRIRQFADITVEARQMGGLVFLFERISFAVGVGGTWKGNVTQFCFPSTCQIHYLAVVLRI